MNLFEKLVFQELYQFDQNIKVILFLISVAFFLFLSCLDTIGISKSERDKRAFSFLVQPILAAACIGMMISVTRHEDSALVKTFDEVMTISQINDFVKLEVDDSVVEIDTNERSSTSDSRILTDALSEVIALPDIEKVLEIKQVSDSSYEIFYRCTCGAVKSYVSRTY